MEYVAYIIIAFTSIQLLVAFTNFLFNQKLSKATKSNKLISVLIPARNEEHNIRNILYDLMEQEYRNIEVLVFDDQSSDNTDAVVKSITITMTGYNLSHQRTTRWLVGKHACHSLSQKPKVTTCCLMPMLN